MENKFYKYSEILKRKKDIDIEICVLDDVSKKYPLKRAKIFLCFIFMLYNLTAILSELLYVGISSPPFEGQESLT